LAWSSTCCHVTMIGDGIMCLTPEDHGLTATAARRIQRTAIPRVDNTLPLRVSGGLPPICSWFRLNEGRSASEIDNLKRIGREVFGMLQRTHRASKPSKLVLEEGPDTQGDRISRPTLIYKKSHNRIDVNRTLTGNQKVGALR